MLLAAAEFLLVIVVVVVLAAGMNASETQERKQPAVTPGLVDWGRSDDAAGRRGGGNWELGIGDGWIGWGVVEEARGVVVLFVR